MSPLSAVFLSTTEAPLLRLSVKLVPTFIALSSVISAVKVISSSTPTVDAPVEVAAVTDATTGAVWSTISTVATTSAAVESLPKISTRKPTSTVRVSTTPSPVPPKRLSACSASTAADLRVTVIVLSAVLTTAVSTSASLRALGAAVPPTAVQVNFSQFRRDFTSASLFSSTVTPSVFIFSPDRTSVPPTRPEPASVTLS